MSVTHIQVPLRLEVELLPLPVRVGRRVEEAATGSAHMSTLSALPTAFPHGPGGARGSATHPGQGPVSAARPSDPELPHQHHFLRLGHLHSPASVFWSQVGKTSPHGF